MLDRSDSNAPNQAMVFSQAVIKAKKELLPETGHSEMVGHITIDSPVPYRMTSVMDLLNAKNTETKPGSSGRPVQGDFFGKLSRFIQRLDAKRVIEVLATTSNWTIDYSDLDEVAISFCLCVKNCLKLYTAEVSLLVLGAAYETRIAELQSQMQRPALDLLGTVLSEQNRIDLLDLIYKKGEVTIHDIEEELGIAGTNAYYHLSKMLRIGMVNTRNRGRTLLYSFNEEYFISVADALLHYIKK